MSLVAQGLRGGGEQLKSAKSSSTTSRVQDQCGLRETLLQTECIVTHTMNEPFDSQVNEAESGV